MTVPPNDLGRTTFTVLFITGLMLATFWVMKPFLPAMLWATTLVLATWPLMLWVERHAGNRRWLAVLIMTLSLLLLLLVPLWLAISTVVTNIDAIADLARKILSMRVPPPPDWLASIPLLGATVARAWGRLTSAGVEEFLPKLEIGRAHV